MAVGACLLQNAVKVISVLFHHRNNTVFSLIGEEQKKIQNGKKRKNDNLQQQKLKTPKKPTICKQ